jgi:carboxymethylenebutenolidase
MGKMIEFQRPDGGSSEAYLAEGPAGAPGLLLIQEWWGLKPHIRELADRFADAGYTALAPDLYRGRIAADADEAKHLMNKLDFIDAIEQDLGGALQFLQQQGCHKVAVIGFCMGGALAIAASVRLPGLAAVCSYYGIPPAALVDPAQIAIPLQAHFAAEDDWCTPATVDAFEKALKAPAEIHRYQAQHAFFNDSRPEVFDAASAALAWQRTLDFFGRQLHG